MTDTGDVKDKGNGLVGEEEDVIDNLTIASLDKMNGDFCRVDVGNFSGNKACHS